MICAQVNSTKVGPCFSFLVCLPEIVKHQKQSYALKEVVPLNFIIFPFSYETKLSNQITRKGMNITGN